MASLAPGSRSSGIVPLAERLRALQLLRVVIVIGVGVFLRFAATDAEVGWRTLATATAAWFAVALGGHGLWLALGRRGLWPFGALLILDGVYLAWLSYATGGSQSPLRYLIVVHLVATMLVASYRTGLKLALWHSLLLWVAYQTEQGGVVAVPPAQAAASGTELERLATFAALLWIVGLATATFSAMNERELRYRRFDLEALARLAAALGDETDPAKAAAVLVTSVADAFSFHRVLLVRLEEHRASVLAATHDDDGDVLDQAWDRLAEESLLLRAHRERRTLLVSRLGAADRWLDTVLPDARNLVVVPLVADGSPIGTMVATRRRRAGERIEGRVVRMTEQFAAHGALALRNAMLLKEMQRLAETDGLTRIANRRTFERALDAELARALRTGEEVSAVMLDIDHFKRLNDLYGHQAGDDVLRRVAATLDDATRPYDIAARYGGEEFVLLLPRTAPEEASAIAERLRRALKASREKPAVSASFGVATFPIHARDKATLIAAADKALYTSKHNGRNRVTLAEDNPFTRRRTRPGAHASAAGSRPDGSSAIRGSGAR